MNRRHMTDDHHGRTAGRATVLVGTPAPRPPTARYPRPADPRNRGMKRAQSVTSTGMPSSRARTQAATGVVSSRSRRPVRRRWSPAVPPRTAAPPDRSGHKAGLNFGDCFAYALSKTPGEALLFKGNDFGHTDITLAVPATPDASPG